MRAQVASAGRTLQGRPVLFALLLSAPCVFMYCLSLLSCQTCLFDMAAWLRDGADPAKLPTASASQQRAAKRRKLSGAAAASAAAAERRRQALGLQTQQQGAAGATGAAVQQVGTVPARVIKLNSLQKQLLAMEAIFSPWVASFADPLAVCKHQALRLAQARRAAQQAAVQARRETQSVTPVSVSGAKLEPQEATGNSGDSTRSGADVAAMDTTDDPVG